MNTAAGVLEQKAAEVIVTFCYNQSVALHSEVG